MGLLKLGRFESAETVLTEVLEHARALEDERLELAAGVELTFVRTVHEHRDRRRALPDRLCGGRAGWKRSAHRSSVAVP